MYLVTKHFYASYGLDPYRFDRRVLDIGCGHVPDAGEGASHYRHRFSLHSPRPFEWWQVTLGRRPYPLLVFSFPCALKLPRGRRLQWWPIRRRS